MKVDQYFLSLNINTSINTLKTIKIEILYFKQIKFIYFQWKMPFYKQHMTWFNNLTLYPHKVVNVTTPKQL